ncbi:MAG: DUF5723 family protein [Bacteroidales bacterium]|jgi:hypothetical protein
MTGKAKLVMMMLSAVLCLDAESQNSQVLYYMNLPQNTFMNPAMKPAEKFYIGLPVITGINAGFGNNFLTLSDLVPPGTKIDSTWTKNPPIDPGKLAGKLANYNTITTDASIQLLGLGMTFGKDLYIFLDVSDRTSEKVIFPGELGKLYLTGDSQLTGKTINLSGMNVLGQYYREYGLGFSKNITSKLRIGAKVKLLSGIASTSLDYNTLTLKVNNDLSQTVTTDAYLNVSGKTTLDRVFSENGILGSSSGSTNTRTDLKGFILDYLKIPVSNPGVSLDIGAVYNLGSMLTISASMTDLGFIDWKKDLKSYKSLNTFSLPGISLSDVKNNSGISIDSMFNSLVNSVKSSFKDTVPKSFRTYLPMSISAGVSVTPLPVLSLGVMSNSRFYAGTVQESVTLSANAYLGRFLSASAAYTMANYTYNNLGFGLAVKAGVAQIYLIADKIPLSWEKIYVQGNDNTYSAYRIPQNMNLLNIQLGLNIVFGKPVSKKTDKPMVIVQ